MSLILSFIQSCMSGVLSTADCGPVWQLSVIAALLLVSIAALLVMRFRGQPA